MKDDDLKEIWKERKAILEIEELPEDDCFIPAKEAQPTPPDEVLIRVEL